MVTARDKAFFDKTQALGRFGPPGFGPPFTQAPFNWQVFDFEGGPHLGFARSHDVHGDGRSSAFPRRGTRRAASSSPASSDGHARVTAEPKSRARYRRLGARESQRGAARASAADHPFRYLPEGSCPGSRANRVKLTGIRDPAGDQGRRLREQMACTSLSPPRPSGDADRVDACGRVGHPAKREQGLAGRRLARSLGGMTVASTLFRFEDSYAREVPGLSVPWTAAPAPDPELLVLNEELAVELGVDPAELREPPGVALLAGQAPEGVTAVAQAYAAATS